MEVSTQQHLDRMQETAKVDYVEYGKSTKNKKGKKYTVWCKWGQLQGQQRPWNKF